MTTDAPVRLRLAVLGDSDSHAYQDERYFPASSGLRGGALHASTLQWTEVLDRLRGRYIDQGSWGTWGTPIKIAETLDWLGLGGRAPRKQDFRYNFAVTGAPCDGLTSGYYRQAPRLASEIRRAPQHWAGAVVLMRIGINTLGTSAALDGFAANPHERAIEAEIDACVAVIEAAVRLLAAEQPALRFVLVGILDNANWPPNFERWHSASERANIGAALDRFDRGLRAIASRHTAVFLDDRALFRRWWGDRDADGRPAYHAAGLGGARAVTNTQGDEPFNAVLVDGHAGTAANGLWAQALVQLLNDAFGAAIPPITDAEIARVADPERRYGLGPAH